ncbi:MAG: histidine kinase [Actinobacteria bacterium]|nr:histidine kinase [Actinomycetota bacterium]
MSSTAIAHKHPEARPNSSALLDFATAAATLAGTLAMLRHGGISPLRPGSGELDLVGIVLAACTTLPLVVWRRAPLGVFVVTAGASALLAGLDYGLDLPLGPTIVLYLLAASRTEEAPWSSRTTTAVVGLLVAYLVASAIAQRGFPGTELLHTGLAWGVGWFAGERARLRREHVAELKERALLVAQEAERERLLAVAEERARIARDLHDSAGHAISVIAVRAGAARLRHHEDPDRAVLALEAIEELARQTAEEIDQIVGSLREGDPPTGVIEDPVGLASLNRLIDLNASAGLEVTLDTKGVARPLGGAADQGVYRILQEALTNAARHGSGGALVELAYGDTAVDLTITNPVLDESPRAGGGHGIVGMRERATLLGGSLDTERVNGHFRVHARIAYGTPRA